jgi:hypothetical protein
MHEKHVALTDECYSLHIALTNLLTGFNAKVRELGHVETILTELVGLTGYESKLRIADDVLKNPLKLVASGPLSHYDLDSVDREWGDADKNQEAEIDSREENSKMPKGKQPTGLWQHIHSYIVVPTRQ